MLQLSAAEAILQQWGEMQRAENIGYPKQAAYCVEHIAGYRESQCDEWEDGRVDYVLRELKRTDHNCYHRLKRHYVDQAREVRVSREREKFCKIWDAVASVDTKLNR